MSNITVWSKPNCGKCELTKKTLTRGNVPFTIKDLTAPENRSQLEKFVAQGLRSAPVVQTPSDTWADFRPDKLSTAIQAYRDSAPQPTVAVTGPSVA